MYLNKLTLFFAQLLFPSLIVKQKTKQKTLWLTFDDGPSDEVTRWILNSLHNLNVKATFFLIGEQIEKYPELYSQIIKDGHNIGNHSYSHKNGWLTSTKNYLYDVEKCELFLKNNVLYRPPYGKLTPYQIKKLTSRYKIILWDILTWDFKKNISSEDIKRNILTNVRPGSIIVFHNNLKSYKKLKDCFIEIITELKESGYSFSTTW